LQIAIDRLQSDGLIEWSSTGNPRKIIFATDHIHHRMQDVWEFKDSHRPVYPTEKNLDLLQTIIKTSSNPGQLVLDAFCGSGTTMLAAELLDRNWIGIDESALAIKTALQRFEQLSTTLFKGSPKFSYIEQVRLGMTDIATPPKHATVLYHPSKQSQLAA
jgi:adenine-specific DNA-methyltransferase